MHLSSVTSVYEARKWEEDIVEIGTIRYSFYDTSLVTH